MAQKSCGVRFHGATGNVELVRGLCSFALVWNLRLEICDQLRVISSNTYGAG
jgi:hypothetical protein